MTPPTCLVRLERIQVDNIRQGEFAGVMCIGREIRRRVLLAFELAESETLEEKKKALMTFVIVGGGPTGVELAGTIAEISRFSLQKDFHNINPSSAQIILIEAGSRVLSLFSDTLSAKAKRDLEKLGVQVLVNSRVEAVTSTGVKIKDGWMASQTVIWAAGVKPSSLNPQLREPLDPQGRVKVDQYLRLPQHPDVFALGDMACVLDQHQKPLPGLAPVALQQGLYVAGQIKALAKGKKISAFKYFDKGQMATIGKSKAVVQFKGLEFSGWIAWMMWLFVHIYYLAGFKNKLFVFTQWAWSYLTLKKGARLILGKDWKQS